MQPIRLLFLLLISHFIFPALAADPPTVCQPSVWALKNQSLQRDGSMSESKATSIRYCLLDGDLEMDEFRALDDAGKIIFRGVSLTFPAGERRDQRTLWVMVGDPGNTLIVNHRDGDRTLSTGHGVDAFGTFDEESTTTYPASGHYRFEMSRKYESIGSWLRPFNIIDAERTSEAPLDLPERPASALRALMDLIPSGEALFSSYILDGHAHLSIVRQENGDDPGTLLLRYAVPVSDTELLIYEWEPGTAKLDSRHVSKR